MKMFMKMLQERSKRKVNRMLLENLIRYRDGKFLYKSNNQEVKGIYFKKKYWFQLGITDPAYGDDYNEMDDLEGEEDVEDV
jgi:hypothetical protein